MARVLSRRAFVRAGVASGALLLARPAGLLAGSIRGATATGASRQSPLLPGTALVHADLHNHTLLSDGDGDAAMAFESMRSAGLDVAALTDHSTVSYGLPTSPCGGSSDCQGVAGINEESWARTSELADLADQPDAFVAIRGFEWSSPTLGHVNVWFSERWTDPLHTVGNTTGEGAAQFLHDEVGGPIEPIAPVLEEIVRAAPTTGVGMAGFYEWLAAPADRPAVGGGLDGIAGFNHPGREQGRFSYFAHDPAVAGRMVSMEIFNRREDFVYEGTELGYPSPLNDCLNAGWRVGLLGVTDEHGTDWGFPEGKGRAGLWVDSLTREGVRAAMEARRFFATRLSGLRVAADAGGVPMGGVVPHRSGPVTFRLDIDRGPEWFGKPLSVQVLRPGSLMPEVATVFDIEVTGEPLELEADLDVADGDWAVLRVSDPAASPDGRADDTFGAFGDAVAYASPFYLDPDGVPAG